MDKNTKSIFDFAESKAQCILPANANAIQILTPQGCFGSECFAGVEHKSTDAKIHYEFVSIGLHVLQRRFLHS